MGIEKNVLKHATLVDGSEQTSEAHNDRQLSFDFSDSKPLRKKSKEEKVEHFFSNIKDAVRILTETEEFLNNNNVQGAAQTQKKIAKFKDALGSIMSEMVSSKEINIFDDVAYSESFKLLEAAELLSRITKKTKIDNAVDKLKQMFDGSKVKREAPQEVVDYYEKDASYDKAREGRFEKLAREAGQLTDEKNKAYGDSFLKAGEFLALVYPNGISPEHYTDALCLVRIFDKLMRIGTKKDAFGESPYKDILGYSLLGFANDEKRKENASAEADKVLSAALNEAAERGQGVATKSYRLPEDPKRPMDTFTSTVKDKSNILSSLFEDTKENLSKPIQDFSITPKVKKEEPWVTRTVWFNDQAYTIKTAPGINAEKAQQLAQAFLDTKETLLTEAEWNQRARQQEVPNELAYDRDRAIFRSEMLKTHVTRETKACGCRGDKASCSNCF